MKLKTQDLTGPALDWAVAIAEGDKVFRPRVGRPTDWDKVDDRWVVRAQVANVAWFADFTYNPSANWSQGGPIIEREKLETRHDGRQSWCAWIGGVGAVHGPTPLVAAMRCYVASRLGDEVDIPEELL